MGLKEARNEAKRLKARRQNLGTVIAEKVEDRRKLQEERRRLVKNFRDKKALEPKNQARADELAARISQIHEEIVDKGAELADLDRKVALRRKRRNKVTDKLKAAQKAIKKALRLSGPDRAIARAHKDNGKHEEPLGSNWGGIVTKMIQFTGYSGPVYWCGCAATWWIVKYGGGDAPTRIRRGYAGFVAADARSNTNGLKAVTAPAKGGWATLWNYEHIVMTTGKVSAGLFETCEGNTSFSANGSQSNGDGCAYGKWRPIADADVFAEQVY